MSASPTAPADVDALVAHTAKKLADVINDFKRELDRRSGIAATAQGTLELALGPAHTWELAIVPDPAGGEHPITVQATLKPPPSPRSPRSPPSLTGLLAPCPPARRVSDVELERDLVSRKRRKLAVDEADTRGKRRRTGTDADADADANANNIMSSITKDDLDDLLAKLRDDIQEDTSECVNHVQRLLRRFKQEWHEKSRWDYEQAQAQQARASFGDASASASASATARPPAGSFPSPGTERDDNNASTRDIVRREAKLISTQIKWVEECRRVAADMHEKREDTWRTSSAGFHDRQRQDRENFQNRVLHESGLHTQTLHQILNEVKAIGLYAQSMKWETPGSHLTYPSPVGPTPPAFPTQPVPIAPAPTQTARGGGRGTAPAHATQPSQR